MAAQLVPIYIVVIFFTLGNFELNVAQDDGSLPTLTTTNPAQSSENPTTTKPASKTGPNGGRMKPWQNALAGTALALLLIAAIAIGLYRPIQSRFFQRKPIAKRVTFSPDTKIPEQSDPENKETTISETNVDGGEQDKEGAPLETKGSTTVKLCDLRSYIKVKMTNAGFKMEFNDIPRRENKDCIVASLPENAPKNRFKNVKAYDATRVVLETETETEDANSNYINANYITGLGEPKAYVAAQGPSENTIKEFWKMIWQVKATRIVMLTRTTENSQKKCEKYWADKTDEEMVFGEIHVKTRRRDTFSAFTICLLHVSQGDETRTVRHLQYIGWPDKSAPEHAYPLLAFRRKVRSLDSISRGPMVVHCSAGIGRTGAFIAIDYLLNKAKAEGCIDVAGLVKQLRGERMDMVQTLHQYKFIYIAVLEAITIGETAVSIAELVQRIPVLTALDDTDTSPLHRQFSMIQRWRPAIPDKNNEGRVEINIDKNRDMDILPVENRRAELLASGSFLNTYINAVFVDAYRNGRGIIATQMPLPNTVDDFWRLVYQYRRNTIVMLNPVDKYDKKCAVYWPDADDPTVRHGGVEIKFLTSDTSGPVMLRAFQLTSTTNKNGDPMIVKHYQLLDWPSSEEVPNVEPLLELIGNVSRMGPVPNSNDSILVHCMDGATRSGLFCAAYYMIKKMRADQEVDVFHAVRCVSVSRPQFVHNMTQYHYLYHLAKEDISLYGIYSNI